MRRAKLISGRGYRPDGTGGWRNPPRRYRLLVASREEKNWPGKELFVKGVDMFAQMYKCSKCGDIWKTETVEHIDTENDDIYRDVVCAVCFSPVTKIEHEGIPVMHVLSEEEMYWDMYSEDDEWEATNVERFCPTCGGEYGDGWSQCSCDEED